MRPQAALCRTAATGTVRGAVSCLLAIAGVGGTGIGWGVVDAGEPGLFDLPVDVRAGTAGRAVRGRNRQTWARTASAEVSVIDAGALREAAARAAEIAVTSELAVDPDVDHTEPGSADVAPASDVFDALGGLIWPTAGMDGPLEAGAFRVLSVGSEVTAESVDRATVTWTVTVKLTDAEELRRLAGEAHPDKGGLIADSLAVAWRCAGDPFAPLHSVPGIIWRPGPVIVEHLPAKTGVDR